MAFLTSGCTDTNSVESGAADGPEEQNPSSNNTLPIEPVSSVYNENNSTSIVRAVKGDTIIVMLEENPTTGYSWNLSADSGLELLNDEYVQDPSGKEMTGSGGVHNWTFEVVEEGMHNISGIYKRPWENVTGDEDTFKLTVDAISPENLIRTTGTVVYVTLEGGFYGITGEDNIKYDPLNLGDEFMEDGLKVVFIAYPVEDMASFHMWGKIVEIRSIQVAAQP